MYHQKPVIGIILGDHAGIGPEIAAMDLSARETLDFIPVVVGNYELFKRSMALVSGSDKLEIKILSDCSTRPTEMQKVYFYDIPACGAIHYGTVSEASGKLIYESMMAMIHLERMGIVDGILMGPITKQSLHAAGLHYSSEFEIFGEAYKCKGVRAVVKAGNIFRCTVVGHVRFSEIASKLTIEGVCDTAESLLSVMKRFIPEDHVKIAVAALNPHAGEDGLFGDEEQTILKPAIARLCANGLQVTGPYPADTVYRHAQIGDVDGIVYLYHDQGNIAMKAASFGEGVLIYTNIPARIVSVGHGGAFDVAGKGIASHENFTASLNALLEMIQKGI